MNRWWVPSSCLSEPTFEVDGRFGDERGADEFRRQRRQRHFAELVEVTAAFHTAPVDGAGHCRRGQVDGELAALADQFIGKTLRADGDRAHRRVGAGHAGSGQAMVMIFRTPPSFPAADQHGGNGIKHGTGFPKQFFTIPGHGTSAKQLYHSRIPSVKKRSVPMLQNPGNDQRRRRPSPVGNEIKIKHDILSGFLASLFHSRYNTIQMQG